MAANMIRTSIKRRPVAGPSAVKFDPVHGASRLAPLLIVTGLILTGCQSNPGSYRGGGYPPRQGPVVIQPAPLSPVQQGDLDPISPSNQQGIPADPSGGGSFDVANAEPPANAQPVTRQAMVGAWTVSTSGSSCQIFLALTKWSGGYRAASRGCSAPAIADVQAWDVKGKQVVLINSTGDTAASMYRSSDQRYDGSTTGGGAISFSR